MPWCQHWSVCYVSSESSFANKKQKYESYSKFYCSCRAVLFSFLNVRYVKLMVFNQALHQLFNSIQFILHCPHLNALLQSDSFWKRKSDIPFLSLCSYRHRYFQLFHESPPYPFYIALASSTVLISWCLSLGRSSTGNAPSRGTTSPCSMKACCECNQSTIYIASGLVLKLKIIK